MLLDEAKEKELLDNFSKLNQNIEKISKLLSDVFEDYIKIKDRYPLEDIFDNYFKIHDYLEKLNKDLEKRERIERMERISGKKSLAEELSDVLENKISNLSDFFKASISSLSIAPVLDSTSVNIKLLSILEKLENKLDSRTPIISTIKSITTAFPDSKTSTSKIIPIKKDETSKNLLNINMLALSFLKAININIKNILNMITIFFTNFIEINKKQLEATKKATEKQKNWFKSLAETISKRFKEAKSKISFFFGLLLGFLLIKFPGLFESLLNIIKGIYNLLSRFFGKKVAGAMMLTTGAFLWFFRGTALKWIFRITKFLLTDLFKKIYAAVADILKLPIPKILRPEAAISKTLMASRFAIFRIIGRILARVPILNILISAFEMIFDALKAFEKPGNLMQKLLKALSYAIFGASKGFSGAISNALKLSGIGFAIGSAVGTPLLGGAIGAIAGFILGFIGGESIFNALMSVVKTMGNILASIPKIFEKIVDWFRDLGRKISDIISRFINWIKRNALKIISISLLIATGPIGWIIAPILLALKAFGPKIKEFSQNISQKAKDAVSNTIKNLLSSFTGFFKKIFGINPGLLLAPLRAASKFISNILEKFKLGDITIFTTKFTHIFSKLISTINIILKTITAEIKLIQASFLKIQIKISEFRKQLELAAFYIPKFSLFKSLLPAAFPSLSAAPIVNVSPRIEVNLEKVAPLLSEQINLLSEIRTFLDELLRIHKDFVDTYKSELFEKEIEKTLKFPFKLF